MPFWSTDVTHNRHVKQQDFYFTFKLSNLPVNNVPILLLKFSVYNIPRMSRKFYQTWAKCIKSALGMNFFDEIWIHYITYTSSLSFEIKWPCFVAKYKHRFSSTKMINWQCKDKEIEGQSNLSLLSFDLWKFDSLSLISACQGSRVYLSHFLQR